MAKAKGKNVRTIKHGLFSYFVPTEIVDSNGEEKTVLVETIAFHRQSVNIPRDADVKRGESLGCFFSAKELEALGLNTEEESGPSQSASPHPPTPDALFNISTASPEEIAGLIRGETLDTSETVALAEDNQEHASKVLEGEKLAHNGQPRVTVVRQLETLGKLNPTPDSGDLGKG